MKIELPGFCCGLVVLFHLAAGLCGDSAFGQVAGVPCRGSLPITAGFVPGFGKAISGETIDYHSVNEYARLALLVRTTDGKRAIEWETETVAQRSGSSSVTFLWLAALSGSKGIHRFDMYVNDKHWFNFKTAGDSTEKAWTVKGENGSMLSFCATEADRFEDLFGYMVLKVPLRSVVKGKPLRIRVVGEAANSPAWYMTFEYTMESRVRVLGLPVLALQHDTLSQIVKVNIDHYSAPQDVAISVGDVPRVRRILEWGVNSVLIPVPAVTNEKSVDVRVTSKGRLLKGEVLTLRPVHRRELYLLPHSHTDIGYSAYQVEVENNHIRYIDEAIELAKRTQDYPEGARFRWNIEVSWALESYLSRATEAQRRILIDAVKKGWIGVNGLFTNTLTGLCRPEELLHLTEYARRVSREFGVPVTSAMITDIPAYTSGTVTALALGGIKYFSSGPNYMPSLPDGGDRIGHALKNWGDRPFYWESQSGQNRVLFWMAGKGYSWFHGWIMGRLNTANLAPIYGYLNDLDKESYPYDMVQLRYTVGGDNGPPDPELADFVKSWNARYVSPKFVISTTEKMFEEFERRYGKSLPTQRGDLTPYWEDGAASTALEESVNRNSAEELVQAEALYSMFVPKAFRPPDFYAAWRNVILFDEHTWGAWNSTSDPDSPSVKAQWLYKQAFAREGSRGAEQLRENVLHLQRLSSEVVSALDIVNTNSWPRSDLIFLPRNIAVAGLKIKDGKGRPVLFQRLSTGELALLVKDVPPMGAVRVFFESGDPFTFDTLIAVGRGTLRNEQFDLSVNPHTGSIDRCIWKMTGMDLVDTLHGTGLNEYLYVPGKDPATVRRDTGVTTTMQERGPLIGSLVIASTPDGCTLLRREVRIISGLDRIDVINTVVKNPVRDMESVHFGFPFRVPNGVVRVDEGWEVIRPDVDQLPGACKDFFSVQRWVDISNDHQGITWATIDAPLVEVGALTDETSGPSGVRTWKEKVTPGQNIYSYVMNNYWHTNYKADQEGVVTFRYSLHPHEAYSRAAADRFGVEQSQPLLVMKTDLSAPPASSLLTVDPPGIVVTSLKPTVDGKGWMVRIMNSGDSSGKVSLRWGVGGNVNFFSSNLFEDRGAPVQLPISLAPTGVVTLRVERSENE